MVPSYVPHNWADGYVHAVPFLQAIVGLMLVIGFLAQLGAFVGTLMIVIFIVGATGLMAEDLPFTPNLIYAGILLMVFLVGPGRWTPTECSLVAETVDGSLHAGPARS